MTLEVMDVILRCDGPCRSAGWREFLWSAGSTLENARQRAEVSGWRSVRTNGGWVDYGPRCDAARCRECGHAPCVCQWREPS